MSTTPEEAAWTTLRGLPVGAIFETRDGVRAVKTEYHYPNGNIESVLLESGEYAHFLDGDETLVTPLAAFPPTETAVCADCGEEEDDVEHVPLSFGYHPFRARPSASTVETADTLWQDVGVMLWSAARWIDQRDNGDERQMQDDMRAMGIWLYNGGIGVRPQPSPSFQSLKDKIAEMQLIEPVAPTPVEPPQEDAPRKIDVEAAFAEIEFVVAHWRRMIGVPVEAAVPESPAPPTYECDTCEDEYDGVPFRWYARDGSTLALCEDCFGKSFAWLWDQVPSDSPAPIEDEASGWDYKPRRLDADEHGFDWSIEYPSGAHGQFYVPTAVERAISLADEARVRAEALVLIIESERRAERAEAEVTCMRAAAQKVSDARNDGELARALSDLDRALVPAVRAGGTMNDNPARGIMYGLVLAIPLWLVVAIVIAVMR